MVHREADEVDGVSKRLLVRDPVPEHGDGDEDDGDVSNLTGGFEGERPARLNHTEGCEDHAKAQGGDQKVGHRIVQHPRVVLGLRQALLLEQRHPDAQKEEISGASDGDMLLILAGNKTTTINAIGNLRLEVAERLGLRDPNLYKPVWVTDFPLFEFDEETKTYHAMHHPFTSPNIEDMELLESDPKMVRANAYDMALNGTEIGGGSIRIHDKELQQKVFNLLGFSDDEAHEKFGFLMEAFEYGAPPHGGIAFGLDRICAVIAGSDSIRDFIAFPKNNSGRDVMLDAPSKIDSDQLNELGLQTK